MIEHKIFKLEGKTLEDYETQLNKYSQQGWKLSGMFGKNNMLVIFQRNVEIKQVKEIEG